MGVKKARGEEGNEANTYCNSTTLLAPKQSQPCELGHEYHCVLHTFGVSVQWRPSCMPNSFRNHIRAASAMKKIVRINLMLAFALVFHRTRRTRMWMCRG